MAEWVSELASEDAAAVRSALVDAAERLPGSGSWACELATGRVTCSENMTRILGLGPGQTVLDRAELLARIHPDDRPRMEACFERMHGRDARLEAWYRVITDHGSTRFVHAVLAARLPRPSGPVVVGWVRDTTEWHAAERELEARSAVTEALSGWEDVDRGGARLLAGLAESLGFTRGVLWIPADELLVARVSWEARDGRGLKSELRDLRLRKGQGLAGQAWERREPVAISSVEGHLAYPFRQAALEHGLRGAMAVPALGSGDVLAVIGLAGPDPLELTERLRASMTAVSREVGGFLAQRQGDLRGSVLSRRELEVLQLAAEGMTGPEIATRLHVSPATVKTHFERIYIRYGVSDRVAAVAKAVREGLIR